MSPTPVLSIGLVEGDEAYLFESIAGAVFLPGGRIAVADRGFLNVRVFDGDGRLGAQMGRRGRGPGEFMGLGGIWTTSEGNIALWDPANRRITVYRADASLLSTAPVLGDDPPGGNLEVFLGAFGNGDPLLASLFFGPAMRDEAIPDRWVIGRYGLDGGFVAHLGHLRGMWRVNRDPIPFSPMPWVAILGDSIFAADGYSSDVTVRNGSGTLRRIDVPAPIRRSTAQAWTSLESELRRRKRELPFGEWNLADLLAGRVPKTDQFPGVAGLLLDDHARLWVKAYDPTVDALWLRLDPLTPAPGGVWRIMERNGTQVATMRVPENVRPTAIRDDRLLGVSVDSLGVQSVVVYTIRKGARGMF